MIKSKEEIIANVKNKLGEDLSDDAIALLEDVSDTLNDYESKVKGDGIDWKAKCEEVEASWKQKYIDRFTSVEPQQIEIKHDEVIDPPKPMKFEDLFD